MKKNNKHVAIIITPLQYINLLEFYNQNTNLDKKNCVVILISHYKKSIEQIEGIGFLKSFEKIIKPMVISRSRVVSFFYTLFVIFKYKKRNQILGYLNNSWCRSFLTQKTIPYVLDDGAASINIFNSRNQNNFQLVAKDYKPTNKFSLLIEIFLNPTKKYSFPINFFSVYEGLKASKDDIIKLNKYSFIQDQYIRGKEKVVVDECWFIGSPLADLGLIEEKKLNELIRNISIFYLKKNIRVRYFGHRTEKSGVIDIENVKFEPNDIPFEIFYLRSKEKPLFLASFLSSCLKNIEVMDESIELFSFYIPQEYRTEKLQKTWHKTQLIYDYFENHTRIKVIKNYN